MRARLSKVEAGQVELELSEFSLREALERGVVMLRERATRNGVSLTLELDPDVELVEADERRIRQVVFNLLSNAVKFNPQGGTVDVTSAQRNGEVLVSVADTGPGIAAADPERIVEKFQQTDLGSDAGADFQTSRAVRLRSPALSESRRTLPSAPTRIPGRQPR